MCVVQIYGQKRGSARPNESFSPLASHQVKDKMEVSP